MTKKIVATIMLVIIILFLSWYAYQEYEKWQHAVEPFIERS